MTKIIQNGNGNIFNFYNCKIVLNAPRQQKPKNKKRKNKKIGIDEIIKYISYALGFMKVIIEIINIIQFIS